MLLFVVLYILRHGEMSEWFKEPVLKTGDSFLRAVGSNPTLSVINIPVRYIVGFEAALKKRLEEAFLAVTDDFCKAQTKNLCKLPCKNQEESHSLRQNLRVSANFT